MKSQYYADKVNSSNKKLLYSVVNELLDKNRDVILPNSNDNYELANCFMYFFVEKIEKIRMKFYKDIQPFDAPTLDSINNKLTSFQRAPPDEIQQVVLSYGIKCSPDDPINLSYHIKKKY